LYPDFCLVALQLGLPTHEVVSLPSTPTETGKLQFTDITVNYRSSWFQNKGLQ